MDRVPRVFDLAALRREVSGDVITPDSTGYDVARAVWNGMIDRHPLAVIRAASLDDVTPVVAVAKDSSLPLAVRGGGHNVAGNGTVDDGLVLDLGGIKPITVDPQSATVTAGPGVTLGDLDRATEPEGLIVPVGVVSGTGLFGLTLGGGFGWLTRSFGLTIDNVIEAQVITAAGDRVSASATENSDLFWGLRGGGGNFGVVSSITYRAQRLGSQIYAGNLIYRRPSWRKALEAHAEWTADLPDELTSIVTFVVPPPEWEIGDETIMAVGFTWVGPGEGAEHLLDRMRALAKPDDEAIDRARWVDWQSAFDVAMPSGSRAYWKNVGFDQLGQPEIGAILDHVERLAPGSAADIHHMGGAVSEVPEDATAFPNRSARYWINIYGYWANAADDDDRIAWTRSFHASLLPSARPGEYVNFMGNEGARANAREAALTAYGPQKFERLVALKRKYDPQNLFRLNHNIPPQTP